MPDRNPDQHGINTAAKRERTGTITGLAQVRSYSATRGNDRLPLLFSLEALAY